MARPGPFAVALCGALLGLGACTKKPPRGSVPYDNLELLAPGGERFSADPSASPRTIEAFEFDDPEEAGWSIPGGGGVELSRGGALSFLGSDRSRLKVTKEIEISCDEVDEIRMRVRGKGLIFLTWSAEEGWDDRKGRVAVQIDDTESEWREIATEVRGHGAWRGDVDRFDVSMVKRWGDLDVDWIRFLKTPKSKRLEVLDSDHGKLLSIGAERRRARPLTSERALTFALQSAEGGDRLRFAVGVPEETERGGGDLAIRLRGGAWTEEIEIDRDAEWHDVEVALPEALPGAIHVTLEGGAGDHVYLTQARVAKGDVSRRPNVLLVTIDTLRRDFLGCYGNEKTRTPTLDGLARDGILFENCSSAANVTAPSHASILSSLYLKDHGLYDNNRRLGGRPIMLAEHLSGAGYATAAVIGSLVLTPAVTNLGQGFSTFFDTHEAKRKAESVNADILPWIEDHAGEPWFAWAHYYDPHTPYDPPSRIVRSYYEGDPRDPEHGELPYRPRFSPVDGWQQITDVNYLIELYRAEVTYADAQLGKLLEGLDELGLAENTILMVTADHGESLTEHEVYFNHLGLFSEVVYVPWIVRASGAAPGLRSPVVAETIDVAPTILRMLGMEVPAMMRGVARDLSAVEPTPPDTRQYFEQSGAASVGVRSDRYHAMLSRRPHTRGERDGKVPLGLELFDWTDDPGLERDIAARDPALTKRMTEHLNRWLGDNIGLESQAVELSAEQRAALQQLGYLGDD